VSVRLAQGKEKTNKYYAQSNDYGVGDYEEKNRQELGQ